MTFLPFEHNQNISFNFLLKIKMIFIIIKYKVTIRSKLSHSAKSSPDKTPMNANIHTYENTIPGQASYPVRPQKGWVSFPPPERP
ncbi:MAG: hypothetical protein KC592_18445, partial [Nitrospira sp.]|nr:hypothetical protein [Nitrospira sp.]